MTTKMIREQLLLRLITSYVEYEMLDRLPAGQKIDLTEKPNYTLPPHHSSRATITHDAQLAIDRLADLIPAASRYIPMVDINFSGVVTISILLRGSPLDTQCDDWPARWGYSQCIKTAASVDRPRD